MSLLGDIGVEWIGKVEAPPKKSESVLASSRKERACLLNALALMCVLLLAVMVVM